jgi:alcohol dehydrogenase (cytochrome c)
VQAIDPLTSNRTCMYELTDLTQAGILTTAADLLFTGSNEGYFFALDARTGGLLWRASVGGQVASGPISYSVQERQYVGVAAGNVLLAYALRQ